MATQSHILQGIPETWTGDNQLLISRLCAPEVPSTRHYSFLTMLRVLQKTPEREKFLEYSDPLFKNRTVFFYARSRYPNGIRWNTLNDLTAYKIGVVDEHSVSTKLKKIVGEKRIKLRIIFTKIFYSIIFGILPVIPLNNYLAMIEGI